MKLILLHCSLLSVLLSLLSSTVSAMSLSSALSASTSGATSVSGPPIRWGIIGLGDVVQHKTGRAFLEAEGSELMAIFSKTPGKAADWAASHAGPGCKGYARLDDLLKDSQCDAYYIAMPPGLHVYTGLKVASFVSAVDRSVSIYMEKPVGRSKDETETLCASLQARGVNLFTAYTSRAYPRTIELKDALKAGRIGQVTKITYRLTGASMVRGMEAETLPWRLCADVSGGGLFLDVGCHLLDRLDFVSGPLVDVTGQAMNRNSPDQDVEDYVWLKARIGAHSGRSEDETTNFCAGADVDCIWDFTSADSDDAEEDELVFEGTNGSMRMKGMSPDGPIRVFGQDGSLEEELTFEPIPLTGLPLIQMVIDELRGKGKCPSNGENARRTSAVMDTVLNGYYGGRGDDFFYRPETWPGIPYIRKQLYLEELLKDTS